MAPEPRAQRWARIRAERREQILAGASRVFARHGLDDSSMALVAAECESTKVTLYAHFRNKELLAAEVLQRWLTAIEHGVSLVGLDTDDLGELLWSIAEGLTAVTMTDDYRSLFRAIHHGKGVPEPILARWERRFNRQRTTLASAFSPSGSPDAGIHASAFLALIDQAGSAHQAGAIVRLFLANYQARTR
ncbi:TetR/AcrR family transcriptional regulator [Stenotrophomonas sp. ISL-67]|uniref:TetR/AcrR family transcriptional regulator n=1 Tax=Stenotrophomonas sp. ISL-67 TaxID=2819171 RepID=UPI001BEA7FBB|nr:TetR/AcrR family transcriptional regulator [Stenotrophomonas sp. ISL-67]MBT2766259.1 TetR/AcrR family transcriptional regulator [Stenotrophomonas sp. ISL-67]